MATTLSRAGDGPVSPREEKAYRQRSAITPPHGAACLEVRTMADLGSKLQAALKRDGVSLRKLGAAVGIDPRTIAKWASDDEYQSRAEAFRLVEDVIEGRARVVSGEPRLEHLGEPTASAAQLVAALETARAALDAHFARTIGSLTASVDAAKGYTATEAAIYVKPDKNDEPILTRPLSGQYAAGMNQNALQTAAKLAKERGKGRMIPYFQKVTPDFRERIDRAARAAGMSASDYVRALVELHTEAID